MRNLFNIFVLLVAIAALLISTKPSDQDCIYQVRGSSTDGLENLERLITTNRYTVQVEDHVFFKTMHSAIDGHKLGTGILGTVIVSP